MTGENKTNRQRELTEGNVESEVRDGKCLKRKKKGGQIHDPLRIYGHWYRMYGDREGKGFVVSAALLLLVG